MKKIFLVISLQLLSLSLFAQSDSIDCCANCDMRCVHYERYSLHCIVSSRSGRMSFLFVDACAEKRLEEIPVLDSIWITTQDDRETVLFKSYNQVGDTIDVSSLAGYHGYYLLHAQLGNCVKERRFVVRAFPSNVDNAEAENTDKSWQKILRDGQLYLKYEGRMYNVQGQKVE